MPAKPNEHPHTYQEIIHHADAWRSAIAATEEQRTNLLQLWQSLHAGEVIFVGCGSTYYLAQTAAVLFQGLAGVIGRAMPSSEIALFPSLYLNTGKPQMLVAISRSGETSETLKAVEVFQAQASSPVIALTCYPESELARTASLALIARNAHEKSVAQTRSFSSMLLMVEAMSMALAGRDQDTLPTLIEQSSTLLDEYHALVKKWGEDDQIDRFVFLGSGPFYGLACEAMLKMKEMSLADSEAFHCLEFRHGPMSMVDQHMLVVGLMSEEAHEYEANVLAEMRRLGAKVLAMSSIGLEDDHANAVIRLPAGWSDLERGPLYMPPLQLLAYYRAVHNQMNPDQPRNLTAVINLDLDAVSLVGKSSGSDHSQQGGE